MYYTIQYTKLLRYIILHFTAVYYTTVYYTIHHYTVLTGLVVGSDVLDDLQVDHARRLLRGTVVVVVIGR